MSSQSTDRAGVVAPPPLIYATGLLLGLWVHSRIPLPLLPAKLRKPVGFSLLGLGILGIASARQLMQKAGTNINPTRPTTVIIREGPYKLSRNPIYLSMTLIYTGLTVLLNTFWGLVFLPAVLFLMNRGVIEREERYLEHKFGDCYTTYKESVPRWL